MENISKFVWFQEGPGVRKNQYTENGVKLLNVANLVNGKIDLSTSKRYISPEEAYGKYKHFLVDDGDLIIASSGIQVDYFDKKMGFITKEHLPLCMNTSTIRFKTLNKDVLDINYFMYFMKSEQFKSQLRRLITGSAQLNFGSSHLEKIKMNVPNMEKQRECVQKLNTITSAIEIKKQQLDELDNLIKSQFVEMFENEKYTKVPLSELATNKVSSAKKDFEQNDIIKYIDISSIDNQSNKMTGYAEYLLKDAPSRAQQHIKKDDIVISTVRPNLKNVAITLYDFDNLVASSGFCVLRANKKSNPKYLMSVVCSDKFTEAMTKVTTGANYPAIHDSDVLDYCVPNPPIELQNQFADFTDHIDKLEFVKIMKRDSATRLEYVEKFV